MLEPGTGHRGVIAPGDERHIAVGHHHGVVVSLVVAPVAVDGVALWAGPSGNSRPPRGRASRRGRRGSAGASPTRCPGARTPHRGSAARRAADGPANGPPAGRPDRRRGSRCASPTARRPAAGSGPRPGPSRPTPATRPPTRSGRGFPAAGTRSAPSRSNTEAAAQLHKHLVADMNASLAGQRHYRGLPISRDARPRRVRSHLDHAELHIVPAGGLRRHMQDPARPVSGPQQGRTGHRDASFAAASLPVARSRRNRASSSRMPGGSYPRTSLVRRTLRLVS